MVDYQQRETTSEYREGWDMIWGKKEKDSEGKVLDFGESRLIRDVLDEVILGIFDNPKNQEI